MEDVSSAAIIDEAFVSLYRSEYLGMVQLGYLLVGSSALSEEIVQDAFIHVAERWMSIASPGAYLRACVVNGCRDSARRGRIENRHRALGEDHSLPEELIELRDALRRLPERRRAALILRYFMDCSESETAEVLKCRPATVRSLVRRGVASLRKELK